MRRFTSALRIFGVIALLGAVGLCVTLAGIYWYLAPKLPSIDNLSEVQLQVPLRVYTRDRRLIAEFGEKRRVPLTLDQIPDRMTEAVLAAEDDRFYEHPGVDWQGLMRAALHVIRTGEKGPGGSTITMQVARNFFLGREKTYVRKLNEILLALKIEKGLTKDQILELYFNKIFLGHRAYGVGAAAQVYYGTTLDQLTLAQQAMIAGLPKAPSRFNPIVNPDRAVKRRNYVLNRMHDLDFIDEAEHEEAIAAPVTASLHGLATEVEAPYVAEMVRAFMDERVGGEAYTEGFRVVTTIDSRLQDAANRALRDNLLAYDQRHGFRGPELEIDLDAEDVNLDRALRDIPVLGGLAPAVITEVGEQSVTAYAKRTGEIDIPWAGLEWARAYVNENRLGAKPKQAADVLKPGDVIRVQLGEEGWTMVQLPGIEGALVALDTGNGAILALAGGFDFYRSKFNRVTQAYRQPGSSFKPFVYSAAVDGGYTAASIINDAPVVFDDPGLEDTWRPENYSGKFFGPTRLREALYKSRNLVSIRLLRGIGIDNALDYVSRFGFDIERLPRDLSLALGSGAVTPLELARGYSVLANGGFLIEPYFVAAVEESGGAVWYEASPSWVCRECDTPQEAASPQSLVKAASQATSQATSQAASQAASLAASQAEGTAERIAGGGDAAGDTARAAAREANMAPRMLAPGNVWLMNSMMRDVVARGTGRRARSLGRKDLAGKTGTTNDQRDAWFSGFTPHVVATGWVGFDQLQPLGRKETGGRAALPMWIDFMRVALEGMPEEILEQPEGLVTVRIDPESGLLASASHPDAIFETFRVDHVPSKRAAPAPVATKVAESPESSEGAAEPTQPEGSGEVTEKLF